VMERPHPVVKQIFDQIDEINAIRRDNAALRARVAELEAVLREAAESMRSVTRTQRVAAERAERALTDATESEATNVCEHGDHPAPEGQRFCSRACQECEAADAPDNMECAGICTVDSGRESEER